MMEGKMYKNLNKILIVLASVAIAFVGINLGTLLFEGVNSDSIRNVVVLGLILGAGIVLLVNAIKNNTNMNSTLAPFILFFSGIIIDDIAPLIYGASNFGLVIYLGIDIAAIVLIAISFKNKKCKFPATIVLIILALSYFIDVLESNAISLGVIAILVSFVIVLESTNKDEMKGNVLEEKE